MSLQPPTIVERLQALFQLKTVQIVYIICGMCTLKISSQCWILLIFSFKLITQQVNTKGQYRCLNKERKKQMTIEYTQGDA
jgi:hypothetical protein